MVATVVATMAAAVREVAPLVMVETRAAMTAAAKEAMAGRTVAVMAAAMADIVAREAREVLMEAVGGNEVRQQALPVDRRVAEAMVVAARAMVLMALAT